MDDEATVEISESVWTGVPVDTSPPADGSSDESAAVAPPGRSRLAVAMLVVSGLLLAGAVLFGVLGMQAQSEATDERDAAAVAISHRNDAAEQEQSIDAERTQLEDKLVALPDKYDAVATAENELVDAHNRYIDIANRSVDLYNNGDTGGSVAVLQNEGAGALGELNTKKDAEATVLQAAEDALHEIQEGL